MLSGAMEVSYLGHSAFKVSNKNVTIVMDPFDPAMLGIKFPKIDRADVVTLSHQHADHNFVANLPSSAFVISGPGEYEVGGVTIRGVASFHDDKKGEERGKNTIYVVTIDGVSVCHLGDLGHLLSDEQKEEIGGVDILMVPVGGIFSLDASVAKATVMELEPLVVIPMHFNRPELKQETFGKLDGVDKFLKEMGAEGVVPQAKLVTSKEKLPETTTVIVLE